MFDDVSLSLRQLERLWRSTIGKKIVMAATGLVMVAFVVAHMLGNLKVFAGAAAFDAYGHWLREIGTPLFPQGGVLWLMRAGLIACVVLHIVAAVQLTRRARAARAAVVAGRASRAGLAARSMRWGGLVLALFVVFHLLDLTVGVANPHGVPGEIHRNVVASLQRPIVAVGYGLGVLALGFHVRHGLWSALQTLGVVVGPAHRTVALITAIVLTVGFLAVPVAVLTGAVGG